MSALGLFEIAELLYGKSLAKKQDEELAWFDAHEERGVANEDLETLNEMTEEDMRSKDIPLDNLCPNCQANLDDDDNVRSITRRSSDYYSPDEFENYCNCCGWKLE